MASEPLRLSEARKHYYAQVPEDLLAETRSVLVVYGYLDRRAGRRGWWADTKRGIGRALELNDKSVRTALRRLEELGLVVIEDGDPVQGGRSSRFVLTERSAASGPHFDEEKRGVRSALRGNQVRTSADRSLLRSEEPTKSTYRYPSASRGRSDPERYRAVVRRSWPWKGEPEQGGLGL